MIVATAATKIMGAAPLVTLTMMLAMLSCVLGVASVHHNRKMRGVVWVTRSR